MRFHDAAGLHVTAVKQVDRRLYALTVATKALRAPASIYVLLPPDYATKPRRRWPVVYLFHGTSGRASDWTVTGHAEKVIGDREVITVMPDAGIDGNGGGWCTDWPNGAQLWESFHIGQILPWVDANLRTQRARRSRAIAGLSQGGFCALSYAARHPDLFSIALGYSGAPDIYYDMTDRMGAMAIINGTEIGLNHMPPDTFFGNPITDGINWAAHDPATLAPNLRSTRMYMYWGSGLPGPLDPEPVSGAFGADEIEAAVAQSNADFQKRLTDLRIPAYFDPYGPGTHTWPYWQRDLQWSIDRIMSDFAHPRRDPKPFTYTSADDAYAVYGWSVQLHRARREFSTLSDEGCHGFTLTGSGTARVTTPRCYRPGRGYRVTVGDKSTVVVAGRDRRLVLDIALEGSTRVLIADSRRTLR